MGQSFKMLDVRYHSRINFNFNLFYVSGYLRDGWPISGGSTYIQLTSPCFEKQIKFDILCVNTKRGMYATMLKHTMELGLIGVDESSRYQAI